MPPVSQTPLAPIASQESLIERFGDWISGLFHKSSDLYNTLTEEEKKAGVWASGAIAVVNANLDSVPQEVIDILKVKFPDLSLDVLHGFLDDLRNKVDNLQSEIPLTLEDAIAWAQKYLGQHKDDHSAWSIISTGAANILATLFSPGTAVEKFIQVGLLIYHAIVKPHVAAPADTVLPAAAPYTPPAQPASTITANTPDKTPAGDINPPADNAEATDPDMQISNEAAANLASASDAPADQAAPATDGNADPIEKAGQEKAAAAAPLSSYHQRNAGEPAIPTPDLTPEQQAAIDSPVDKPNFGSPDTGESGQYKDHKEDLPTNDPNSPQFGSQPDAAVDPSTLTPGTDAFNAAVEAEVQKRLAQGNG